MELLHELSDWWITLKDSTVLHLRADGYSRRDGNLVFSVLVKGTPNYEVELASVPEGAVAKVRGG